MLVRARASACIALALTIITALRLADGAPAADGESLLGVNASRGYIDLVMQAPAGATVTFSELVDGAPVVLGTSTSVAPRTGGDAGLAPVPGPVAWRCDRLLRRFSAEARATDGRVVTAVNEVRTPDCRDRIAIVAPKRVAPGTRVPITLKDRWQQGDLAVRVCTARSAKARRCARVAFAPGERALSFERDAGDGVGVLDIDVLVARSHVHRKVGVGRAAPAEALPTALITGDSLIQGIDSLLATKLKRRYRVISQTRPGTGVSKELGKPWPVLAREQAKRHTPAVTVVLLGGNDGFAMQTASGAKVRCCGERWRVEYLARITEMATAYARKGRGTVVWSLLPPTRREDLVEPIAAVNDAVRRLAEAHPAVRLVPLDRVFGPAFRAEIGGQTVRDPDGLHFSPAGHRLAANAILAALRGDSTTPTTQDTP